jgi:hypothetical protein
VLVTLLEKSMLATTIPFVDYSPGKLMAWMEFDIDKGDK